MTDIIESIWERFRNNIATEADLKAIWQSNESDLAADSALSRCPDFDAFMRPLIWQIERMDWMDEAETIEPTMADAMAVLASVEQEQELLIEYHCTKCSHDWQEQWSCACDSECPNCGQSDIEASDWKELAP